MSKTTKTRKYHKSKAKRTNSKKAKTLVSTISYPDYIEQIKSSKKYTESLEYLRLFVESREDSSVTWKFKSNLQKFIKKHILIKDLFGSEAFSDFQHYLEGMASKEEFVKVCEEIVRKVNDGDKKVVYDVLTQQVTAMEEEDYDKLAERIRKRCVILVEG